MSSPIVTLRRPQDRGTESAPAKAPVPLTRRAYIETYGCQMNIGDSELLAGALADRGYLQVSAPELADVIVVNTCAIREHAEQRVLGRIGQLQQARRSRPDVVLAVTGCMAQRMGSDLLEKTSGVDLVAGPDSYRRIADLVDGIREGGIERGQLLLELDEEENYEGIPSIRGKGTGAWVTVQRGCDHRCTFCIVPYVRGPEKNRSPEEVLAEVRAAVGAGYSEITLLGQTVNSYRHGDVRFSELLEEVARVAGVRRVRFTSPHPNDVDDALLDVMAAEPAVCSQLHLPVQSGSNRVLRRMVRRYTREEFLEIVERVRSRVPGIALSTDVIVGFPGETEVDFEATLDLMRRVRFDDAYLYRYSAREGTPATRLPAGDFLDEEISGRRLSALIALQREIQREIHESEIGSVVEVLVEREARTEGDLLGRTEANKVVVFPAGRVRIGAFVEVRLRSTTGATFLGTVVR
ncbi:MAG: tRNA (N6-isopentenyl adenosine(37)-C2)-methylthiotransferase MiaB [marine benthic group bacterium]|nr:tRNA (N6-isopentenyl adenosine(37)-C2)-methylthiotransferase MiaB [Gemmatimonadota bacterium]